MRFPWFIAPCFVVLASAGSSSAQVNVEPIRKQLEEQGVTANARVGVLGRTGNTQGLEASAGTLLGVAGGRSLAYLSASGNYAEYEGQTLVAKGFAHLRFNYRLLPRLAGELFAQLEADRFRRLVSRTLLGLGPRAMLFESQVARLHYGTSAMFESTRRNDAVPDADREVQSLRWNHYLAFTLKLHERIELTTTAYYQPRFDDFGDFWFLNASGVHFQVTDRLASRIDVTVRREAVVPPGVELVDTEVSNSLELTF